MRQIVVAGDIHRDFVGFQRWLKRHGPSVVLQCGDFGYWPRVPTIASRGRLLPNRLDAGASRVFFCDGNHEDHASLRGLSDLQVYPNVFYMPRGSTLRLPDGRMVLFIGGATSVDRDLRTPGIDWFGEEVLSVSDLHGLPNVEVDIIVSHTCPLEFGMADRRLHGEDPSRIVLSLVLAHYRPKWWFFGHFHVFRSGVTQGCRWMGLAKIGMANWSYGLPDGAVEDHPTVSAEAR